MFKSQSLKFVNVSLSTANGTLQMWLRLPTLRWENYLGLSKWAPSDGMNSENQNRKVGKWIIESARWEELGKGSLIWDTGTMGKGHRDALGAKTGSQMTADKEMATSVQLP
jgi:hypothetical protein